MCIKRLCQLYVKIFFLFFKPAFNILKNLLDHMDMIKIFIYI